MVIKRKKQKMNKKGMTILLGIMLFIFSFLIAVITAPVLRDIITDARATSTKDPITNITTGGMNCGSDDLTTGESATCIFIDLVLPLFVGVVIFAGLGKVSDKFIGE